MELDPIITIAMAAGGYVVSAVHPAVDDEGETITVEQVHVFTSEDSLLQFVGRTLSQAIEQTAKDDREGLIPIPTE